MSTAARLSSILCPSYVSRSALETRSTLLEALAFDAAAEVAELGAGLATGLGLGVGGLDGDRAIAGPDVDQGHGLRVDQLRLAGLGVEPHGRPLRDRRGLADVLLLADQ